MTRPASLYLRLSREARAEGTGMRSQESDLRTLAAEHGLTVTAVRVDDGESGDKRGRAAYRAWLADGRAGMVLLAYHLDRVSRGGLAGIAEFLDVIDGRDGDRRVPGTRFLSFSDRLDSDSPDWIIRVSVMAGLAQAERQRIAERSRRARKQRKAEGRYSGGPVPYGFRVAPNPAGAGKVLVADPAEVAALQEAGRRVLLGESLTRVARWLTEHGPAPRRTAAWSRQTVRQALLGPAVGVCFNPADARALRAVLGVLGDRHAPPAAPRQRAPFRLLSGVLLCSGCGRPLVVSSLRSGRILYRCNTRSAVSGAARECPRGVAAIAEAVEEAVSSEWLAGWGPVPETVVVSLADETANALAAAEDEVARLAAEVVAAARGARGPALAALEEAEVARDRLAAVPIVRVNVLRDTGRTYGEAWASAGVEDRRDLLLATAGTLRLGPGVPGRHGFRIDRLAPDCERLTPAESDASDGMTVLLYSPSSVLSLEH